MFRSLMTIITELYLYLTKVIFMSKHLVKLFYYNEDRFCFYKIATCFDPVRSSSGIYKVYKCIYDMQRGSFYI